MEGRAPKILIVEDEKPMARALQLKLTHSGFDVLNVYDGDQAKSALENELFDLIISDLMMPQMDGFQVLDFLLSRGIQTPVIVLSNLSQEEDIQKALSLGAKAFYVKSNTPIKDIVESVKTFLV